MGSASEPFRPSVDTFVPYSSASTLIMSSDSSSLSDLLQTLNATVQAAETERNSLRTEAASLREEVKNLRAQLVKRDAEAAAACEAIISAVRVLNPSASCLAPQVSSPPAAACVPIFGTPRVDGEESAQSMSRSVPSVNPFSKSASFFSTSIGAEGKDAASRSDAPQASVTDDPKGARVALGLGSADSGTRPNFPSSGLAENHPTSTTKVGPLFQFGTNAFSFTPPSEAVVTNCCKDKTPLPTALTAPFQLDASGSSTGPKSVASAGDKKSTEVSFVAGQSPRAAHRRSTPSFCFSTSFAPSDVSSVAATSKPLLPNCSSSPGKSNTSKVETDSLPRPDGSGLKNVSPKLSALESTATNSATDGTAKGQSLPKPARKKSTAATRSGKKTDNKKTSLSLAAEQSTKSFTRSLDASSTLPTANNKVTESSCAPFFSSPSASFPIVSSEARKVSVGVVGHELVESHAAQPAMSTANRNTSRANSGTRSSDSVSVDGNFVDRAVCHATLNTEADEVESVTVTNSVSQSNENMNGLEDTANAVAMGAIKKGGGGDAGKGSSALKKGGNLRRRSVSKKAFQVRAAAEVQENTNLDKQTKHTATQKSTAATSC